MTTTKSEALRELALAVSVLRLDLDDMDPGDGKQVAHVLGRARAVIERWETYEGTPDPSVLIMEGVRNARDGWIDTEATVLTAFITHAWDLEPADIRRIARYLLERYPEETDR
jgi:hypothetical protein